MNRSNMKKLLFCLILLSLSFAVKIDYGSEPGIRESLANGKARSSYQAIMLEVKGQAVTTTNGLTWYADNIAGYSYISLYGLTASAGNATTISAQSVYADGTTTGLAAQTITSGTPTAAIWSPYYKLTYANNHTAATTVTFNFFVID